MAKTYIILPPKKKENAFQLGGFSVWAPPFWEGKCVCKVSLYFLESSQSISKKIAKNREKRKKIKVRIKPEIIFKVILKTNTLHVYKITHPYLS